MGKSTIHQHPNQLIYTAQQIGLTSLFALMILAALMLLIVALWLPAPLFIIVSGLVLLLSAFVLMGIVNMPPITIADDGITLKPMIGSPRHIHWSDIEAVAPYPLLPQPNQEILKQYLIGRRKYQGAEGIMLIVPTLPWPYRIAGALAGERGAPIVAFTNRAHTDYPQLANRILRGAAPVVRESLTSEE